MFTMKKLFITLVVLLLSAQVHSVVFSVTPIYLSIAQPTEYYYEIANFVSTPDNIWHNYGTLNQTVVLTYAQYVDIGYGVSGDVSPGVGHFVTRVLVDGVEKRQFRSIDGNSNFIHNSVFSRVFLAAGTHYITLQYRTPHNINANTANDWKIGYLKLIY